MIVMSKNLSAFLMAAIFVGGLFGSLSAQEQRGADEAPRLTPEERREQWTQMRGEAERDRAERLRQFRERRGTAGASDEAVPESYLDQLEFSSVLSMGGETQFTLRNRFEDRTLVLTEERGRNGVEVVEFDRAANALTVSHEGETRTLHLRASRVAALAEQPSERDLRRQMWEERREQIQRFRETWREAAETSPELREIEAQFRDLGGDFRQNRAALQEAEPGTPEYQRLRQREQEMREEFRLLAEYSMLEVRRNPAFAEEDVGSVHGMMRGMMVGEDRREGRRGR